jgi:hypothetical protein
MKGGRVEGVVLIGTKKLIELADEIVIQGLRSGGVLEESLLY